MKVVMSFIVVLFTIGAAFEDEKSEEENNESYNERPRYNYEYGVHDPITKDIKKHWETRDGNFVKGSYRFVQPDGSLRIVDYNSDDKNGFNAFVKYEGLSEHPYETETQPEFYEAPAHVENLQDSFDLNFLPEDYASSATPPEPLYNERKNEENLNSAPKNKSIHSYDPKGRKPGEGKGYEVEENPEAKENIEDEEEEEND